MENGNNLQILQIRTEIMATADCFVNFGVCCFVATALLQVALQRKVSGSKHGSLVTNDDNDEELSKDLFPYKTVQSGDNCESGHVSFQVDRHLSEKVMPNFVAFCTESFKYRCVCCRMLFCGQRRSWSCKIRDVQLDFLTRLYFQRNCCCRALPQQERHPLVLTNNRGISALSRIKIWNTKFGK